MRFKEFTTADGKSCLVNIEKIALAVPGAEEGELILMDAEKRIIATVPQDAFREAVKDDRGTSELPSKIERLIQAMDRMTVHFPTSIRMHI